METKNQNNMENIQNKVEKKKMKKGAKIFLIILSLFVFGQCMRICGSSENEVENTESTVFNEYSIIPDSMIEEESVVVEESISRIDSVKIKELKPYFREKKDEFRGVTWIEPKSRPKYTNMNGICTYFCVDENGKPGNLRFLIQYFAEDWLFINGYTFVIDGKRFTFSNPDVERDHNHNIWEWSDTSVSSDNEVYQILSAIREAKEVKIRFHGRQYNKDKTLTQKDIKAITQPIEYFEALGGKF
jgi:hypothetical protein